MALDLFLFFFFSFPLFSPPSPFLILEQCSYSLFVSIHGTFLRRLEIGDREKQQTHWLFELGLCWASIPCIRIPSLQGSISRFPSFTIPILSWSLYPLSTLPVYGRHTTPRLLPYLPYLLHRLFLDWFCNSSRRKREIVAARDCNLRLKGWRSRENEATKGKEEERERADGHPPSQALLRHHYHWPVTMMHGSGKNGKLTVFETFWKRETPKCVLKRPTTCSSY